MSAFLVEDKTINMVVTYFSYSRGCDSDYYRRILLEAGYDISGLVGREKLGEDMFKMNVAAVTDRYKGGAEDFRPLNYRFTLEGNNTIFQILKSMRCFLYQCAEGDVPERPLYQVLERLSAQVAFEIVRRCPEWERAQWN